MQKTFTLLFIFFFFIAYYECRSSHMLGADIEYTVRNKDTLDIYLTVYKDCKGITLTSPIITLRGIDSSYAYNYGMNLVSCGDVTPVCKTSCSKCNGSSCNAYGYPNGSNASCTFPYGIEKLVYKNTLILNKISSCKFRVEYSQGSRSGAISNCCANEKLFTYCEFDRCKFPNNTSPKAVGIASSIVCVGNCMGINAGAIDTVDNDIIFYKLAPALNAYGSSCTYQGSYTYQYPLYYDGFPSIKKYNPKTCKGICTDSMGTGNIYCKPMQQQTASIALDIFEYRSDSNCRLTLVGLTRRDFTIMVVANCTNKTPTFPDSIVHVNPGAKICFDSIQSSDANNKDTVTFSWNNAIPKAKFETGYKSNSIKQYFNFCWQTDSNDVRREPYSFSVTAEDNACPIIGKCAKSFTIYIDRPLDSSKVVHNVKKLACGGILLEVDYLLGNSCSYNYQWYIDNNNYNYSLTGQNVTVNNLASGKHYIKLEVSNNTVFYTYYDTVDIVGHVQLDIGNNTYTCEGNPVTFYAKVKQGTPPYQYYWFRSKSDTLNSLVMNGTVSDTLYCMVTDSEKCVIIDSTILYIRQNPILNLGPDVRACGGSQITLAAPKSFGYIWKDSNTNQVISKAAFVKTDTSITVICYITDTNGCKNQDTISALFNPKVKVDIGSDRNICIGDSIHIIAKGRGTHYWTYDSTATHIGDTLSFLPSSTTKVVVKGSETLYNLTCEAVSGIMVKLFPPPSIYLKDSFFVCKGDSRYIQVFGGTNFLWNTGNTTRTVLAGVPGKFSVTVFDTMGCHSSAQTELFNYPPTNISLSFSNDTLYVSSSISIKSFQWNLDSQYYTKTILPWLYITKAGTYKVNVLDNNNCFASTQPYLVTTLHNYITSIETIKDFKIYPNPSTGIYYIESNTTLNDITIYDLMGRKVYNSSANKNIIDLCSQAEGVYLLQINGNVWIRLSKL